MSFKEKISKVVAGLLGPQSHEQKQEALTTEVVGNHKVDVIVSRTSEVPTQEAGNDEVQIRQKRPRYDRCADDKRLTGDYDVPSDAIPLTMPQIHNDKPVVKSSIGPPGKVGGLRFKPQNTLGQQQIGRSSGVQGSAGTNKARMSGQLQLQSSRDIVVPSARSALGGEPISNGNRSAKRRKLDHTSASPTSKRGPIMIEDDEQEKGNGLRKVSLTGSRPVIRNGRDYVEDRVISKKQENMFEPPGRETDGLLNHRTSKKRRPNSQSNDQEGQSLTSSSPDTGRAQRFAVGVYVGGKSKQSIPVSNEDDDFSSILPARAGSNHPRPANKIPPPSQAFTLHDDLPLVKAGLSPKLHENPGLGLTEVEMQRDTVQTGRDSEVRRTSNAAKRQYESPTSRLSSKFVRDTGETEPKRLKASERMLAKSRTEPSTGRTLDGEQSSADELSRGHYAPSRTTRKASLDPDMPTTSTHPSRHPKPPPTDSSRQNSPSLASANHAIVGDALQDRVPVTEIFARCGVLRGNDLFLLWDDDCDAYLLESGGERKRVIKRDALFTLGRAEAQAWTASSESTSVMLRGARDNNSSGVMVITFASISGRNACQDRLLYASKEDMSISCVTPDRLQKLLSTQTAEITKDCEKLQSVVQIANEGVHVQQQHRLGNAQSPDEERIRYDDEGSLSGDRQPPARGTRQRRNEAPQVTSKFFPSFSEQDARRRSTRQVRRIDLKTPTPPPRPERWTEVHKPQRWSHSVLYPEAGVRRVTVDFSDLERLDEGELFNDNIISFAMRRIEEGMKPEHRSKVHFFNSFFYTSLMTKNGKKAFNYDGVKKWTKSKDLFSTPYIVIPINLDLHWFVAIICNLPILSREPVNDVEEESNGTTKDARGNPPSSSPRGHQPVVLDSQDQQKPNDEADAMRQLSLDEQNAVVREDSEVFHFDEEGQIDAEHTDITGKVETQPTVSQPSPKRPKKRGAPPLRKIAPDQPVIITLDSFGISRSTEIGNLKNYLSEEAKDKRGMDLDRNQLKGLTAKGIPEQNNFSDCGVYLIGYVEQFAKDPQAFIQKVLSRELNKKEDFATFTPSGQRSELRDALLKLHDEQESARRAAKKEKAKANPSATIKAGVPTSEPLGNAVSLLKTPAKPSKSSPTTHRVTPIEEVKSARQHPLDSIEAVTNEPSALATKSSTTHMPAHAMVMHPAVEQDVSVDDLELAVPRALYEEASDSHLPKLPASQTSPRPGQDIEHPTDPGTGPNEMLDRSQPNETLENGTGGHVVDSTLLDSFNMVLEAKERFARRSVCAEEEAGNSREVINNSFSSNDTAGEV